MTSQLPPFGPPVCAVKAAFGSGLFAAMTAVADGIYLVARRRVAECPDGKVFPDDVTDPTCYVHPQAGLGVGLIAIAVMLAALLVLATALVNGRTGSPSDEQA
jgi:hypothetical protein